MKIVVAVVKAAGDESGSSKVCLRRSVAHVAVHAACKSEALNDFET